MTDRHTGERAVRYVCNGADVVNMEAPEYRGASLIEHSVIIPRMALYPSSYQCRQLGKMFFSFHDCQIETPLCFCIICDLLI